MGVAGAGQTAEAGSVVKALHLPTKGFPPGFESTFVKKKKKSHSVVRLPETV